MSWIAVRNFEIEKTERGFVVLRYESQTQEFVSLGEREDLRDALLLMLDEVKAQIELDEFVEISPWTCISKEEQAIFIEKRRKARAKLTLSVRDCK